MFPFAWCWQPGNNTEICAQHAFVRYDYLTNAGKSITNPEGGKFAGEINRGFLGPLVFGDKQEMAKLTALVWPVMRRKLETVIAAKAG